MACVVNFFRIRNFRCQIRNQCPKRLKNGGTNNSGQAAVASSTYEKKRILACRPLGGSVRLWPGAAGFGLGPLFLIPGYATDHTYSGTGHYTPSGT